MSKSLLSADLKLVEAKFHRSGRELLRLVLTGTETREQRDEIIRVGELHRIYKVVMEEIRADLLGQ